MFTSTEKAIQYGKQNPQQKDMLRKHREVYRLFTEAFKLLGDLDKALECATHAQFCREAIEAIDNE